jgi:hypothetical protein
MLFLVKSIVLKKYNLEETRKSIVFKKYNLEGRRKSIVLKKYNLEETRKTMHCLKKIINLHLKSSNIAFLIDDNSVRNPRVYIKSKAY